MRQMNSLLVVSLFAVALAWGADPPAKTPAPDTHSDASLPRAKASATASEGKLPSVRIQRILDPGGTQTIELSCSAKAKDSPVECSVRMFVEKKRGKKTEQEILGAGKLDLKTSTDIVDAFFKALGKQRKRDAGEPASGSLMVWEVEAGAKSAKGIIARKETDRSAEAQSETGAVLGLEGSLFQKLGRP